MLRKKKKEIKIGIEQPMTIIDEVIGNEDLAFNISSYLCPSRNPFRLLDLCNNLCFVSNRWNTSFSLVRAQLRWDYLTQHIGKDEDKDWLYHKLSYFPGGCANVDGNLVSYPREGCLKIYRSNAKNACNDASKEYRKNIQNDEHSDMIRTDSRPDYYYRAHRECPECIEFVLPRPLLWDCPIHYVNEIEYDDKPRLVNKFTGCLGDINGAQNPMAQEKSVEGVWNLGYHEIKSVRDMITCNCNHRPPLNGYGEESSSFLNACKAKPSADPRWLKFSHLVGEDRCRLFLKKHLLPMIGPRPTGIAWNTK